MRLFLLLSFLITVQSHAQLLRGVDSIDLISDVPSKIKMADEPFEVRFQLKNKKGKVSKNKKIIFQVLEGKSEIRNASERSDQDGVVSFVFVPASSEGTTKVKIQYSSILNKVAKEADKIANDLIDVDLRDTKEKTLIQEFVVSGGDPSIDKSVIKTEQKSVKQSQKTISVKVEVRNNRGALIDKEEIPSISANGEELEIVDKKKLSDGSYEVTYSRPKGAGVKKLKIDFLGEDRNEQIHVLPEIDFASSKVEISKAEDDVYSVRPKLVDLDGGKITANVESSISINDQKLKAVKDQDGFKVVVPEGKGSAKVSYKASLGGKSGVISKSFDWQYAPYGPENIAAQASPEKIIATGFDTSIIRVTFKGKSATQIQRIIEDSNFSVSITEGDGQVGELVQKKGADGSYYLEAEFTAPSAPGESHFKIMDGGEVLIEGLKVSYDVKVGLCESENIIDYDTVRSFIGDNIDLIKKISANGETKTQGFQMSNTGPNDIVPSGWERQFEFEFPDQAKQLMKLQLSHWCRTDDCKVSATNMNSSMYFFPRDELPRMEILDGSKVKVTLPTGEEVLFDKETKKIVGGVLEEGPVDAREDRFSRTFPDVRYKGKGYVLRVNGRGQQPESGNFNPSSISGEYGNKGGAGAMIYRYNEAKGKTEKCVVSKSKVFKKKYRGEPIKENEVGAFFRFSTDKQFYDFVESNCQFK